MSTSDFEVIAPKELAELREKAARYEHLLEHGVVDWNDLDYQRIKVHFPAPENMVGFDDLSDAIDRCRGVTNAPQADAQHWSEGLPPGDVLGVFGPGSGA